MVKNPPTNAEYVRGSGGIPGSGRFPRERNGNPLEYSCLENPTEELGGLQTLWDHRVGHD